MQQIFWQAPDTHARSSSYSESHSSAWKDIPCLARPSPSQHLLSVAGKLIATDLPPLCISRHPASTAIRHEVTSDCPHVLRTTQNSPKRTKHFPASACIIRLTACMRNTSLALQNTSALCTGTEFLTPQFLTFPLPGNLAFTPDD